MSVNEPKDERSRLRLQYASKTAGGRNVRLPFRLLVLGHFSPCHPEKMQSLRSRKTWTVDRANLPQVMASLAPELALAVSDCLADGEPAEDAISIRLKFRRREDFVPDRIIENADPLQQLARRREQLKALDARLAGNEALRTQVEASLRDRKVREQLRSELQSLMARRQAVSDATDPPADESGPAP